MEWLTDLLVGDSIAHIVLTLGIVVAAGMALGRVKICGISLGVAFVLLIGIVMGHLGMKFSDGDSHFVDPHVLHFLQEFGLILFVFAVGLQSGPSFVRAFKKGGLKLNLLAVSIVALNLLLVLFFAAFFDMETLVGVLSGAVTNTPGLGAAQAAVSAAGGNAELLSTAYAMAYPLGVLGIIGTVVAIRLVFHVDVKKENELLGKESSGAAAVEAAKPLPISKAMIWIFAGIALGMIVGNIPIYIPGVPRPLKLGLAGGPLVVTLVIGAKIPNLLSRSALSFASDLGICLFLACVGLKNGEVFVETALNGGLAWVGIGFAITAIPLLIVGFLAYGLFKVDYFTLTGMIAGSMTDPPALSYSVNAAGNDRPAVGYATVYPLVMFLRIVSAQALILFAL